MNDEPGFYVGAALLGLSAAAIGLAGFGALDDVAWWLLTRAFTGEQLATAGRWAIGLLVVMGGVAVGGRQMVRHRAPLGGRAAAVWHELIHAAVVRFALAKRGWRHGRVTAHADGSGTVDIHRPRRFRTVDDLAMTMAPYWAGDDAHACTSDRRDADAMGATPQEWAEARRIADEALRASRVWREREAAKLGAS